MIRAFLLFIIQAPLIAAGALFVVPIMIPFRKTDESTRKPYTQYPELGEYVFTNYPGWWGNPCDGLIGDKRGEFAKWCVDHGIKPGGFLAMYIWTAVRNPINTWSRLVVGVMFPSARSQSCGEMMSCRRNPAFMAFSTSLPHETMGNAFRGSTPCFLGSLGLTRR